MDDLGGSEARLTPEDTSKSPSQNGTSEKDGCSLVEFFSSIPTSQHEVESGELVVRYCFRG